MTIARLSLALVLSAATVFASSDAPAPVVQGRVADADGKPISGVAIYSTKSDSAATLRALVATPAKLETDEEGRFSLSLAPGTYDFVFRKSGFVTKRVRAQKVAKKQRALHAVLERAAVVGGRVARTDGSPIPNVIVDATNVADSIAAKTGADGSFLFEELPAGEQTLLASKPDEMIHELKTITAPARDVAFAIDTGGTIRGRVVAEATGAPIEKFTVHLSPLAARIGLPTTRPIAKPIASKDGSFELRHVASSEIQITITAQDFLPSKLTPAWLESGTTLDTGVVAMTSGTRVDGTVTSGGAPVQGVAISLEAPDGSEVSGLEWVTARTNADGTFALVAPPYREWDVAFRKPGFISAKKRAIVSDTPQTIDVELDKGLQVTGVVVDRNNKPIGGATIRAYSSMQGTESLRTIADDAGRFALEGFVEGRYVFEASKPGFVTGEKQEVNLRKVREVRLVLDTGATLSGTIRGLDDAMMMSEVWIVAEGSGTVVRERAEGSGKFRMHVPPGTLRVSASIDTPAMQRMTSVKSVEATHGRESRVDLDFAAGSSVRGIVTRDASPIAGHFVTAEPFDPRVRTRARTTTRSTGVYELTGLDTGDYTVRVLDRGRVLYERVVKVDGAIAHDIQIATSRIMGQVIDAKSGQPLAGAAIALKKNSKESTDVFGIAAAVSDAEGRYAMNAVPPGDYEIRVHKDSYGQVLVETKLEAGETVVQNFKLDPREDIALRIYDERDGKPLTAEIWVLDGMKRTVLQGSPKPGNDGRVRFSVSPGKYFVSVGSIGYAGKIVQFRVPTGGEVAIPMSPGGSIVFHSGAKQLVRIVHVSGSCYLPSFYSGQCEFPLEPGTTKFDFLQKGHWTVHVLGEDGKTLRTYPFDIEDGIAVNVQL